MKKSPCLLKIECFNYAKKSGNSVLLVELSEGLRRVSRLSQLNSLACSRKAWLCGVGIREILSGRHYCCCRCVLLEHFSLRGFFGGVYISHNIIVGV